jgi:hypothetical protein
VVVVPDELPVVEEPPVVEVELPMFDPLVEEPPVVDEPPVELPL